MLWIDAWMTRKISRWQQYEQQGKRQMIQEFQREYQQESTFVRKTEEVLQRRVAYF